MINIGKHDIWKFHTGTGPWIVIPTNVGWTKGGENVMGAGIAKQAKERYPDLPRYYGKHCMQYGSELYFTSRGLIMFPVKPLDGLFPHLSWKRDADLALIERSTLRLQQKFSTSSATVVVPLVGCGNGKLKREDVEPILMRHLDDHFLLVEPL